MTGLTLDKSRGIDEYIVRGDGFDNTLFIKPNCKGWRDISRGGNFVGSFRCKKENVVEYIKEYLMN